MAIDYSRVSPNLLANFGLSPSGFPMPSAGSGGGAPSQPFVRGQGPKGSTDETEYLIDGQWIPENQVPQSYWERAGGEGERGGHTLNYPSRRSMAGIQKLLQEAQGAAGARPQNAEGKVRMALSALGERQGLSPQEVQDMSGALSEMFADSISGRQTSRAGYNLSPAAMQLLGSVAGQLPSFAQSAISQLQSSGGSLSARTPAQAMFGDDMMASLHSGNYGALERDPATGQMRFAGGGPQGNLADDAARAAQGGGPRYSQRPDGTIYDRQSGVVWSENMAPQDVLDAVYGAGVKTSTRPYNAATLPGQQAAPTRNGVVQENVFGNPTQAERDLGTRSTIPGFNLPPYGTPGHPAYQGPSTGQPGMGTGPAPTGPGGGGFGIPRMYTPGYVDTTGSAGSIFGAYMGPGTGGGGGGGYAGGGGGGFVPPAGIQLQQQGGPAPMGASGPQMSAMPVMPEGGAGPSYSIQSAGVGPDISNPAIKGYDSQGFPLGADGRRLAIGGMLSASSGTGVGGGTGTLPPNEDITDAGGPKPPEGTRGDGVQGTPVYDQNGNILGWNVPEGPPTRVPDGQGGFLEIPARTTFRPAPQPQQPQQPPQRAPQYPSEIERDQAAAARDRAAIDQIIAGITNDTVTADRIKALLPGEIDLQRANAAQIYAVIDNLARTHGLNVDRFKLDQARTEAEMTGRYGDQYTMDYQRTYGFGPDGTPTLDTRRFQFQQEMDRARLGLDADLRYAESRRADSRLGMDEGAITGYYGGSPTLQRNQFEANATGYYNGAPTMAREQLISDTERANLLAQASMGNMAAQIRLKEIDQAEFQRQFNVRTEMDWRQNPTSLLDRVYNNRATASAPSGTSMGAFQMPQSQQMQAQPQMGANFAMPQSQQGSGNSGALTYGEIQRSGGVSPGVDAALRGDRVMPAYQNAGGMPTVSGQALNQMSPSERSVFDATLRSTGNDPMDYEWNRRRLTGGALRSGGGFSAPRPTL